MKPVVSRNVPRAVFFLFVRAVTAVRVDDDAEDSIQALAVNPEESCRMVLKKILPFMVTMSVGSGHPTSAQFSWQRVDPEAKSWTPISALRPSIIRQRVSLPSTFT